MKQTNKENFLITFFCTIVRPRFQFITLFFVSSAIIFMAYHPVQRFYALEPYPPLLPITPQKIKAWGGEPVPVKVGLYIRSFSVFDFVANKFVIDGILWFEFDPALISLETVNKFSFEKGTLTAKSAPYTKIIDDKFFARFDIQFEFSIDLNYTYFPFDDHRMSIILVNRYIPPSEMIFISYESYFSIDQSIEISGWEEEGKTVKTGYSESRLEKLDPEKVVLHPKTVFSIDYRRSGIRYILLIILPLCIIFFVGLFSFAFDPKKHATMILGLATGTITSLLSYRFVIERITPQVGYFVFSDYIFTLLLSLSVLEFIFAIVMISVGHLTRFLIIARGVIFLTFHFLFLFMWYYFLHLLV